MGKSLQGGGNFSPSTIYLGKEIQWRIYVELILSSSNMFSKKKKNWKNSKNNLFSPSDCVTNGPIEVVLVADLMTLLSSLVPKRSIHLVTQSHKFANFVSHHSSQIPYPSEYIIVWLLFISVFFLFPWIKSVVVRILAGPRSDFNKKRLDIQIILLSIKNKKEQEGMNFAVPICKT